VPPEVGAFIPLLWSEQLISGYFWLVPFADDQNFTAIGSAIRFGNAIAMPLIRFRKPMAMQPEGSERFGRRFGRGGGSEPEKRKTCYLSSTY